MPSEILPAPKMGVCTICGTSIDLNELPGGTCIAHFGRTLLDLCWKAFPSRHFKVHKAFNPLVKFSGIIKAEKLPVGVREWVFARTFGRVGIAAEFVFLLPGTFDEQPTDEEVLEFAKAQIEADHRFVHLLVERIMQRDPSEWIAESMVGVPVFDRLEMSDWDTSVMPKITNLKRAIRYVDEMFGVPEKMQKYRADLERELSRARRIYEDASKKKQEANEERSFSAVFNVISPALDEVDLQRYQEGRFSEEDVIFFLKKVMLDPLDSEFERVDRGLMYGMEHDELCVGAPVESEQKYDGSLTREEFVSLEAIRDVFGSKFEISVREFSVGCSDCKAGDSVRFARVSAVVGKHRFYGEYILGDR